RCDGPSRAIAAAGAGAAYRPQARLTNARHARSAKAHDGKRAGVCGLAHAASREDRLAVDPAAVFGCQEDGDRPDILGNAHAAERRLRDGHGLEVALDDAHRARALRVDDAGVDRIDADLPGPEFLREGMRDRVDRALRAVV